MFARLIPTIPLPVLAILVIAVGAFASSKYNEGATVFLQNATSDESSATLVFAEQLAAAQAPGAQAQ